jgi:hypothetical protein
LIFSGVPCPGVGFAAKIWPGHQSEPLEEVHPVRTGFAILVFLSGIGLMPAKIHQEICQDALFLSS